MSRFYLHSASQSSSPTSSHRSSIDTELPFPAPLPRSDFLKPGFTPAAYLSEVAPHRHQVLEDLRSDLRVRSQQLSRELLDLVNAHYVDFLGLGTSLRGGNEKVQELRVDLMSFQRELETVHGFLVGREAEVRSLVEERQMIREKLEIGRRLLEWEEKVSLLQDRLNIDPIDNVHVFRAEARNASREFGSEADEDEYDDDGREDSTKDLDLDLDGTSAKALEQTFTRLKHRVNEYRLVELLSTRLGLDHPFISNHQYRITQFRNTLLLDLGNCLKEAGRSTTWKLRVMALYSAMDASKEAVEMLRSKSSIHTIRHF